MTATIFELFSFPLAAADLALSAIRFSESAFARAASSPAAQSIAVLIAFFAGVSEMLGQSVILVVNRVPLYRFLASLAFTGVSYVLTAITWAGSAALLIAITRGSAALDGPAILGVISLAFAPRIFGAFSLAPYFGVALANALEVWAMALAIFGLHTALNVPFGPAIFCGVIGWFVSFMLRSFLGRALAKPLAALRRAVSGSRLELSPQQIIDDLVASLKDGRAQ